MKTFGFTKGDIKFLAHILECDWEFYSRMVDQDQDADEDSDESWLEVRIQVSQDPQDGKWQWQLHYGDPGFDQDHRGVWGNTSVLLLGRPTREFFLETAKELLEDAESSLP